MNYKFVYTVMLSTILETTVVSGAVGQTLNIVPGQISQLPPPPAAERAIPDIRITRPAPAPADGGTAGPSVRIHALHITGQTRFSEAQLVAAAGFTTDAAVGLSDLRRMAARISDYYSARGYVVAQAYVPAQEIKDGVVTIVVIEGRYGAIKLRNGSRLHDDTARGVLRGLDPGDVVAAAPLERRLLLLSDIPGVQVKSTLSPGAQVGASDLQVDLTAGRRITGDLEADNGGNPYTGAYEGGGAVNFNELLGIGDVASIRALTAGSGMAYVRGSYKAQLADATVGAAYAYFDYRLGGKFASLHADGSEQIASLYASYPLIRSYDNNLQALADLDHRTFRDETGRIAVATDRQANVVTVGLNGDHRDSLGGGGSDAYSLYLSGGELDIQTALARALDAQTARTQGGYGKLTFNLDRLQTIGGPFSLYADVRGQVASKNLDISEKMELGGPYAVRAYPEGEAYGDEGYVGTLEGRVRLPDGWVRPAGRTQLIGFVDTGWVRLDANPWASGSDSATRSGAGVGLDWSIVNNVEVKASYAFRLGPAATSAPDSSGQFWFQLVKFF
jgi:hemolysin activation/secretion protein